MVLVDPVTEKHIDSNVLGWSGGEMWFHARFSETIAAKPPWLVLDISFDGRGLSMQMYPGGTQRRRAASSYDMCHHCHVSVRRSTSLHSSSTRRATVVDLFPMDCTFSNPKCKHLLALTFDLFDCVVACTPPVNIRLDLSRALVR